MQARDMRGLPSLDGESTSVSWFVKTVDAYGNPVYDAMFKEKAARNYAAQLKADDKPAILIRVTSTVEVIDG